MALNYLNHPTITHREMALHNQVIKISWPLSKRLWGIIRKAGIARSSMLYGQIESRKTVHGEKPI
jgi:hypothetical protein